MPARRSLHSAANFAYNEAGLDALMVSQDCDRPGPASACGDAERLRRYAFNWCAMNVLTIVALVSERHDIGQGSVIERDGTGGSPGPTDSVPLRPIKPNERDDASIYCRIRRSACSGGWGFSERCSIAVPCSLRP